MANFLGRLGALAPSVLEIATPALNSLEGSQVEDAVVALQKVLAQYTALATRGEKLRQILTTGVTIPCEVWNAYNQACLDYVQKSQPIFDQLAQQGVLVDQVVYSGGQPVPDSNRPGQYKTLRVSAPLRPPAFTFIQAQCPGIANFQGAPVGGWYPVPIVPELGAVSDAALRSFKFGVFFLLTGPVGIAGAVGYSGATALSQIAVWVSDYLESPKTIIDAYTACFDRQVSAGVKPDRANATCLNVQQQAQAYAKSKAAAGGWSFWTWVMVGGAVLVAGGALALYLRKRALGLLPGFSGSRHHQCSMLPRW